MCTALEGCKVLVVEDEFLVASLLEDMLQSAGCVVKGPVARVPEALDTIEKERCDAAVLDVNLGGERIDPVAHALADRNIPFVFVTGYGHAALPAEYAERPRLRKPFRMADLFATLSSFMRVAK
jgi:CheY-like chemotaxis protein